MYCEECGTTISNYNEQGDSICKDCEVYCSHCGCYCTGESVVEMCEDCYEDYIEDLKKDEDYDYED